MLVLGLAPKLRHELPRMLTAVRGKASDAPVGLPAPVDALADDTNMQGFGALAHSNAPAVIHAFSVVLTTLTRMLETGKMNAEDAREIAAELPALMQKIDANDVSETLEDAVAGILGL